MRKGRKISIFHADGPPYENVMEVRHQKDQTNSTFIRFKSTQIIE